MDNKDYYSTQQVMRLLGISRQWVYHYHKIGVIRSFQLTPLGWHRFYKEDVDKLRAKKNK